MHIVQTVGLALATDLVQPEDQPKVVGLMYVMLLVGMILSALTYGALLETYTPGRLIQVIQGTAVVTIALNGLAMWQQEARDRRRAAAPRDETAFTTALRQLSARRGMLRLLAVIALGTAGFGMADVLLEPFGGQVLSMTVAQTTRLTVVMACGSLVGFALASRWLGRDGWQPMTVALMGAAIGIPAFGLVMASAALLTVPLLILATVMAGFGAGLFGHGTLTATMRAAPREQIGLSLGAWGAVQTTAAGAAVAIGGVIRDAMLLSPHAAPATPAAPYLPVFGLEALLLMLALIVAWPMRRQGIDESQAAAISLPQGNQAGPDGLAETRP
jgi:BCD family chlorophyll transporter-like MFS transporter